eukprot:325874-Ditylum_brightwellii.AAC.1
MQEVANEVRSQKDPLLLDVVCGHDECLDNEENEVHNVEDTLRQSGSGKFGEIEICKFLVKLTRYSVMSRSNSPKLDVPAADLDPQSKEKTGLC